MGNIFEKLPGIRENVPLRNYTTYKIGGPAKYFFVAKNKEGLIKSLELAKEFKLPVFILGGGSNLLVSDKGFKGLVVKIDICDINFENNIAFVGAGANLTKLAYLSADKGFSGLEWSAGVPGTIGGAIYGHAQAFGTKISEIIESVEVLDSKTLEIKNLTKEQCNFSTKNSIFKENKNLVIISAVLKFNEKDADSVKNKIKELLEYRRKNHPVEFPSAGSVFINPEIKIEDQKLLDKFPELKEFNKKGVVPSGYLIAKSGLAGKKIGGAQISEKHANFIINLGEASAKDILKLIKLAQKEVKKNFKIELETEVQIL